VPYLSRLRWWFTTKRRYIKCTHYAPLPYLLFSSYSRCTRQTDVRQKHRLMPLLLGAGHNNLCSHLMYVSTLQHVMKTRNWWEFPSRAVKSTWKFPTGFAQTHIIRLKSNWNLYFMYYLCTLVYYAPPLIGRGIKRCFYLTSVCLSVCLSVCRVR